MGDMTTIRLCMCFVQKSVFLITCPVQRDVLLSNYMHANVAKRDSVFLVILVCVRGRFIALSADGKNTIGLLRLLYMCFV